MEESDKPFACTVDGCKMSFTNEDHLTVHKKKHDMVLNLGTGQKSNVFVADQTPTPTRFIRNCEEVGLFQDLQNVNPFEETFRKAVEAAKSGQTHLGVDSSLTVPSGTDDTLHTPHVFPHIIEDQTTSPVLISSTSVITENSRRKSPTREELDHSLHPSSTTGVGNGNSEVRSQHQRSTVKVVRQEADTSQQRIITQQLVTGIVKKEIPEASSNVQLILRMPDGKLVQVQGVSMEHVETVPAVQVAAPVVTNPGTGTVVLSAHGTSVLSSSHAVISSSPPATVNNKMALAKERLKQQLIKSNRVSKGGFLKTSMSNLVRINELNIKQHSASDSSESITPPNRPRRCASADDIEKRKKFLERNRAAAMRCRKKRKTWIQSLEQRAEDMQQTNHTLQSEVAALRAEVAQLKTLLLAHKDCPVTHAMAQGVPAPPMSQSQHVINVSLPLLTQNNLSGATTVSSTVQQPMMMSTVPKSQVVLLNKPSIAKRRASNTSLSTPVSKKSLVENTVAPQTLFLTSTVNSSDSVTVMSSNCKAQHNLVTSGSVGNVATTMVTGTNVMIPSVVVTPSHVQEMVQSDSSLVPVSLDQIPAFLLPKSLCLSSVGMTQEHHIPPADSDNTTGITPVIKLNPNVTRTDKTDSRGRHGKKSISNGHGEDSDVEIIMEIHQKTELC